jgi:hypothetical protein
MGAALKMSSGMIYLLIAAGIPLLVVLIGSAINHYVYGRRSWWRW